MTTMGLRSGDVCLGHLVLHEILEADHETGHIADLAHGEHDAGHEARPIDRVVADRESLPLSAEEDLLVRDETRQANAVDRDVVDEGAACALGDLGLATGSLRDGGPCTRR